MNRAGDDGVGAAGRDSTGKAWSRHDEALAVASSSSSAALREPPCPEPLAPLHVPDHTLLRVVGRGAYGDVWLAENVLGTPAQ